MFDGPVVITIDSANFDISMVWFLIIYRVLGRLQPPDDDSAPLSRQLSKNARTEVDFVVPAQLCKASFDHAVSRSLDSVSCHHRRQSSHSHEVRNLWLEVLEHYGSLGPRWDDTVLRLLGRLDEQELGQVDRANCACDYDVHKAM